MHQDKRTITGKCDPVETNPHACISSCAFEDGRLTCILYNNLLFLSSVTTCTDLGHSVDNGNVSYSSNPTEQGQYVENTTVTVLCDEGYRGGGDIICQNDGNWSSLSLLRCTSEPAVVIKYLYTHAVLDPICCAIFI